MPNIKIISNPTAYSLNKNWVHAKKFDSKDRIVDEHGRRIASDYKGCRYRIIEKKERVFSCFERISRGCLGMVAVISTLGLALLLKPVKNLFTKFKENIRFAVLESNDKVLEKFDPEQLVTARFSDFTSTGKCVSGSGSGTCSIYKSKNGTEYVMKKNNVLEFYAGTIFQLILEQRSAKVLFITNDSDFYVGSQFEPSYREIWKYHFDNKKIPEKDLEGLSLIIVASFFLGEIDLKGLSAANSNIGLKSFNNEDIFFKIDHEQTFVFGGDYWKENYIIDKELKNKLRNYADELKLNFVTDELLKKAVQHIISIPLKMVEKTCDFCEDQLRNYPEILKKHIDSSSEELFFGLSGATTIKEAVLARFRLLCQHADF